MERIATALSVGAALLFLSNCAEIPYAQRDFDESHSRSLNDTSYDRFACRAHDHDFLHCR